MADDYIDGGTGSANLIDGGSPLAVDLIDGGPPPLVIEKVVEATAPSDSRVVWLESMDGSVTIPLNVDAERILIGGATGLGVAPVELKTSTTPGMPGSNLDSIEDREREVFLPLYFASDESQDAFFASMKRLRDTVLTSQEITPGQTGTFRLLVSSSVGTRSLDVAYKSGLEGSWGLTASGARWEKFGLTLVAVDPYWRARRTTELIYRASPGSPFLSTSSSNPWPRSLAASVAIGDDMRVFVEGEVPVWPTLTVWGPASFAAMRWPGANVRVPNGVADASTLVLRTDPRKRSARLDGAIAWDRIAFDSVVAPLYPGDSIMSAEVGTSGSDTGMSLTWTPGYKTAW